MQRSPAHPPALVVPPRGRRCGGTDSRGDSGRRREHASTFHYRGRRSHAQVSTELLAELLERGERRDTRRVGVRSRERVEQPKRCVGARRLRVQPSLCERCARLPLPFARQLRTARRGTPHEQPCEPETLGVSPAVELDRVVDMYTVEELAQVELHDPRVVARLRGVGERDGIDDERHVFRQRHARAEARHGVASEDAAKVRERIGERVARTALVAIAPEDADHLIARRGQRTHRQPRQYSELAAPCGEGLDLPTVGAEQRQAAKRAEPEGNALVGERPDVIDILPCLLHRRCLLVPAPRQMYSAVGRGPFKGLRRGG